ncbi:MAG: tRNA lysidine(34) synthetase TilS [Prevotellaceae bacterium]|nr:tRNA lysidine(34) synthetase TilS [Candidatus Minthosoma caballi]
MDKILHKIESFIREKHLLTARGRVVVGLSGGPDSVCLMRVLNELGYGVVAVHCNFHLRGEESMRDERFAENLCEAMGVKLVKTDFDTEAWAKAHGMSIEMAARELRYDFFDRMMSENGCEAIAVGHHKDDNAETLLLNIVRGTGIAGACGIQPRNGNVVRPLLCVQRDEVIEWLESIGQDWVTDHTNLEDEYSRNKIRLDVMPVLEAINSGAAANIATTIENLNEVRKVYESAMKCTMEQCVQRDEMGCIRIDKDKLTSAPSPISVLHEVLSPLGFNRSQMQNMLREQNETGRMFAGNGGRRLLIDRDAFVIEPERMAMPEIEMNTVGIGDVTILKDAQYAYLDSDKVRGELTIRLPKDGDDFAPFGMKGRRKLLSDFLTDLKMNRFEKECQPLLCDGDEIAWVVGKRSSELYRVDNGTKRVILCRVSWRK